MQSIVIFLVCHFFANKAMIKEVEELNFISKILSVTFLLFIGVDCGMGIFMIIEYY